MIIFLLECEPIDLNHFVVNLRERHLDYWTPYSDMHPRECSSKHSTYHQWYNLPPFQEGSGHTFAIHPF